MKTRTNSGRSGEAAPTMKTGCASANGIPSVYSEKACRILVVDDEPVSLRRVAIILSREGYSVTEMTDGFSALAEIEKSPKPDLVILDILMPGINGFEICEKIRKKHAAIDLPVIMLTGKAEKTFLVQSFESGANDYLTKPFFKEELLARVRTQITLAKLHNSLRESNEQLAGKVRERTAELTEAAGKMRKIEGALVTSNEELEKALNIANEMAKKARAASMAKSEFLANMSHEIRTPINAIMGMARMLWATVIRDEQKHQVKVIRYSCDNLLELINDILDLSKVEAGQLRLEKIGFNLLDVLDKTCEVMSHRASEKGLVLRCEADADPCGYPSVHMRRGDSAARMPVRLIGDPARLRQILINLLSNAIKFTPSGEISVEVGLAKSGMVKTPDGQGPDTVDLLFTVRDTGIGISEDKQHMIFDMFAQADFSTSREFGGTGLGLTICKQLVELMNGEIGVESIPDIGSSFHFTARFGVDPVGIARIDSPADQKIAEEINASAPLRVLLVEDNEYNRMVFQYYLNEITHRIDIAEDGQKAVEKYICGEYDIVFMDISMPVMDGYNATRIIRKWERENGVRPVSIVALTARAMKGDREKCHECGMDDYLTKPFEAEQLHSVLARWTSAGGIVSETVSPAVVSGVASENNMIFPVDLPGIDVASGVARFRGNKTLFSELLIGFSKDYADSAEQVGMLLEGGDIETARRLIHTVKGIAGNFSAGRLSATAADLEAGIGVTDGKTDMLIREYRNALSEVLASATHLGNTLEPTETGERGFLARQSEPAVKPCASDILPAIETLARLLECNSLESSATLTSVKTSLREYPVTAEIEIMEKQLSGFDFKGARKTLGELSKKLETNLSKTRFKGEEK